MLKEKRLSRQKRLLQDTCESIPRSLPKKVQQQTVKHNYQQLTKIPQILHAEYIKHLYLSHNKIINLKGIEPFFCLETLNVSYNCLQKVQQLRRISNPLQLRHLKIRMNPLQFGYEDYAVGLFQNLKTFQDIKLKSLSKQNLRIMSEYISKNILSFIKITNKFRDVLNIDQFNKENNDYANIGKRNTSKPITFVGLNIDFLNELKELYTFPAQEALRNRSISALLVQIHAILQLVCQSTVHKGENNKQQYLKQTKQSYLEVIDLILLKYSARYDKTLISYLNKLEKQLNLKNYSQAFSKLGVFTQEDVSKFEVKMTAGGLKLPLMRSHPAKYIEKIDVNKLDAHPMNKLANWQPPKNLKTLIPFEQSKWYHFYNRGDLDEEENQLFQQIPLFIYCKTYLQVISEIVFERVSQILNKQNEILRYKDFQAKICNQTVISKPGEDEIQFQLSRSDALSFGDKQNQIFQMKNESKNEKKQKNEKGNLRFFEFQQKTLPRQFANRVIPHNIQRNTAYNIEKYSLHDINLAYKVFRSLKRRVSKRKEKLSLQP